jgi:hypothetical protein
MEDSNVDGHGGGVDGDGSGGNSPSRQGAKTETSVPRNWSPMVAALQNFSSTEARQFRVFPQREYIGGRAMSEGVLGAHTRWWRGQGHPRHLVVWPPPGPPPSLLWTLSRVRKIGGLAFVSSNSENISYVTFLKYKNSRK